MMRYSDIESFVSTGLTQLGYGTTFGMPLIDAGPSSVAALQKLSPGPILFLSVGNGAGLAKEGLFDKPFIIARVIGVQGDFGYAEDLAYAVDELLLAVDSNTKIGTAPTLYITRTAGAPQLIDYDDAGRYHFQTTYIAEAQR